jgi:putative ABC transport system permease protein
MYFKVGEIKQYREIKYIYLIGFDPKGFILNTFTVDILEGRQLKKGETSKVVLGYNFLVPDKIFQEPQKVGDKIEINGKSFDIVGFYKEIGNPTDDSQIYLTYEGFDELYPDTKDQFSFVMLKAGTGEDPEELALKIKDKLRKYKDQEEGKEDFFVQTFTDVLSTFTNIISILNGVLILIAFVSLLVASVNIINTMYTAILERTKEIGIMKAIGARNQDILMIFLIESGFLGMIGGIIGVILGYLISTAGGSIAAASGFSSLRPKFPVLLTIGSILFAFFIGAVSGILPAIRASKLNPVDALRTE